MNAGTDVKHSARSESQRLFTFSRGLLLHLLHIAVLSVCSQAARSTSNWTPAVAGGRAGGRWRSDGQRKIGSLLKISAAAASVLGDLKESRISVRLCSLHCGDQGGRKGEGSANERASQRDERRPQLVVGEGGRERGRGARGEGRNGLKNDTQLLLMFRLSASQATTPLDFFKPQTTTTTAATNCDQSRFSVRLGLLLQLRRGMSMYPRRVGSLRCNRWSRVWANDLTSGVFIPSCHEEKKNLPPFLHSLLIQTLRIPARFKN